MLLLMVPSADLLQPLLRTITLESIKLFTSVVQLPHSTEGFIVMVGTRRYIVVDECSGLAFVALAMFLGYAFGLFLYRSLHKVVGLALLGAGLGVLCNVVRVNAIVWLDWVNGSQMDLAAHGHIQWLALLAVLGALLYVLTLLRGDAVSAPSATVALREATPRESRGPWLAPVAAGLSVLVFVSGMNAVLARAAGSALPDGSAIQAQGQELPARIAGWRRATDAADWSLATDGSAATRTLVYRRGEQQMHVHLVQTRTPEAKLPVPRPADVLPGHWRDVQTQRHAECDARHCGTFLQTTLKLEGQKQRQDVYSAYAIGGLVTDSTLSLRTAHAWARVTGHGWRQSALALSFDGEAPGADELLALMRALQAGEVR
jgi:exosortase/archaeosortase family protein